MAGKFCLSTLRETQYKPPRLPLEMSEKRLLVSNKHNLGGHGRYLIQILRAINQEALLTDKDKIRRDMEELFRQPATTSCADMMCTRSCSERKDYYQEYCKKHQITGLVDSGTHSTVQPFFCLELLSADFAHPAYIPFRTWAANQVMCAPEWELETYIPTLV